MLSLSADFVLVTQERTYRSPEKRSSLPRPAKSLTRHLPAAEQEDNSAPTRPTCKNTHSFCFDTLIPPHTPTQKTTTKKKQHPLYALCTSSYLLSTPTCPQYSGTAIQSRADSRTGRSPAMAGSAPSSSSPSLSIPSSLLHPSSSPFVDLSHKEVIIALRQVVSDKQKI